jgi:hypothetical protein
MISNNRSYRRYSIFARADILMKNETKPVRIHTLVNSISEVGIGLYSNAPIERFAEISITIEFFNVEGKKENDSIDGKVVWLTRQDEMYYLGVFFNEELDAERQPHLHRHFHRVIKDD